jgi:predicted RNA methylase
MNPHKSMAAATTPNWITRIRWSLKRRGLLGTVRLAFLKPRRSLAGWLWDRKYGVETGRIVEIGNLKISSGNTKYAIRYQPTPMGAFRKIIRGLGIPYESFNFVDFGSGKGRTLLLAAGFPFRRVIGIEFAPELHKIAESNIRQFRGRQHCQMVQSVCMDAAEYRLPPGNSVLYFNFPFHEPLMKAVLARIDEFLQGSPAEIFIVNYEPNPAIERLLAADPAFARIDMSIEHSIYRSRNRAEADVHAPPRQNHHAN